MKRPKLVRECERLKTRALEIGKTQAAWRKLNPELQPSWAPVIVNRRQKPLTRRAHVLRHILANAEAQKRVIVVLNGRWGMAIGPSRRAPF